MIVLSAKKHLLLRAFCELQCRLRLTPCCGPLLLQIAKRQGVVNPENTFFSVKRFIGRKMDEVKDESKQVGQR